MGTDTILIIIGLVLASVYVVLVVINLKHEREFLQSLGSDYKRGKGYTAQAA